MLERKVNLTSLPNCATLDSLPLLALYFKFIIIKIRSQTLKKNYKCKKSSKANRAREACICVCIYIDHDKANM